MKEEILYLNISY